MVPGSTKTNRKEFLDEAVVLARFGAISQRVFGLSASGLADRKQFEEHETAGNAELRRTRGKRSCQTTLSTITMMPASTVKHF
jgi:hypothetical protein